MSDKKESISDKLRHWADIGEPLSPLLAAIQEFGIKETTDWGDVRSLFRRIADEIDREKREIYEAQEDSSGYRTSPHHIVKAYAGNVGKPMRDGECITDWLDRYYLPKPLFEDGEPLQIGDRHVMGDGSEDTVSSLSYTKGDHDYVSVNGHRRELHERVRRPKPQVLDADGVPIEVGDVGWLVHLSEPHKVRVDELLPDGQIRALRLDDDHDWDEHFVTNAENFTHREPDSQERIDEDATIAPGWYCEKYGIELSSGADFAETYIKMTEHILRRQRELDGRDA